MWKDYRKPRPIIKYSPPSQSYPCNDCEKVEKLVRVELLSIAFVFGPKHISVQNLTKISEKSLPLTLTQNINKRTAGQAAISSECKSESIGTIRGGSIPSRSKCCIHLHKPNICSALFSTLVIRYRTKYNKEKIQK